MHVYAEITSYVVVAKSHIRFLIRTLMDASLIIPMYLRVFY